MEFERVSKSERKNESRIKEVKEVSSTLADPSSSHVDINKEIAKRYPMNSQIAILRHAIKSLMNQAGISGDEFDEFNSFCDEIVENSKKKSK